MNCIRTYEVVAIEHFKKGEVRVTCEAVAESSLVFYTTSAAAPRVHDRITANLSWKEDQ